MESWLQLVRWEDAVDIAAVALFSWLAIRYLRRTRARPALVGLAGLGVVYAVANGLDLRLTASLFQGFFAVVVFVLVVVFQEDIRRFLEQLGSWRPGRSRPADQDDTISLIVRVAANLAEHRTGALIVLPREEPIDRHVDGGVPLNGAASEPLLLSLFDASSPGHDGAVILRDGIVERFAAHLPLSVNEQALRNRGTRHAAALGLAELCDAVCIVVSEERGTISVARNGELRRVQSQQLASLLTEDDSAKPESPPPWRRDAWVEGVVAVATAILVWIVFVPGSDVSDLVLSADVEVSNLPDDLELEAVEPAAVEVTLRGLRRDLVLADAEAVRVRVDGYLARFGRRTFSVEESDVLRPDALSVLMVSPERVRLSLSPVAPNGSKKTP